MGVDVSLKIRMINPENNKIKEVMVSDQDNSLASLLSGEKEIRYTSIKIENEGFLTESEFNKVKLNYDETKEMIEESRIMDSDEAVMILEKIFNYLYRKKQDALNNDLSIIDSRELSDASKQERKQSLIGEYFDFESSFGIINGIIKTAKELGWNIQIVGEYY